MKNPIGLLPGGRAITLEEYLALPDYPDHDVGCPICRQQLQLIGRNSQHLGFPRWEHMPFEGIVCDRIEVR